MPSTPTNAMSTLRRASVCSASGPTSSWDSGRAEPPQTTRPICGRSANSDAMLMALVTTFRPDMVARTRATSVVVVPPLKATDATPSVTSAAAAFAIRRFSSWCCPPRYRIGSS